MSCRTSLENSQVLSKDHFRGIGSIGKTNNEDIYFDTSWREPLGTPLISLHNLPVLATVDFL
jgi:hypothetical protein